MATIVRREITMDFPADDFFVQEKGSITYRMVFHLKEVVGRFLWYTNNKTSAGRGESGLMGALETVKKTIEKHRLIQGGDAVIIGFSGGPDSTCLLHCLQRIFAGPDQEVSFYAVHINHGLRGGDADADEKYAEEFCRQHRIAFCSFRFDVARIAAESGISTEDAGRRVRYQTFEKVRHSILEGEAQSVFGPLGPEQAVRPEAGRKGQRRCLIAVAQNADDQAETVLMRMMRGTGIRGLGAMSHRREDGIVRPLLDVTRREIEEYCSEHQLEPRIDGTNLEPDYTRNRVRLELLPYMREHFNPGVSSALVRLAEAAREDESYLDQAAEGQWKQGLAELPQLPGEFRLRAEWLRLQHPALRRRIIFKGMELLGLNKNIAQSHVAQAEQVIFSQRNGACAVFPEGFSIKIFHDKVIFSGMRKDEDGKGEEGEKQYRIEREEAAFGETVDPKGMPWNIRSFDRAALEGAGMIPVVRHRRPGDFIRPLGGTGSKKLQDFFVDKKVPREMRDKVPLVCLGSEVIWIVGDPNKNRAFGVISDTYKLRPDTRTVLLLRILMKEPLQGLELKPELW